MGIGSSLRKTFGGGLSGLGGAVGFLGGPTGPIAGKFIGSELEQILTPQQRTELEGAESGQITAANVFAKLSPEQQKDILINNPNIVTALGEQQFDPLTNTIRLTEAPFVQEQRERQQQLAQQLSGQLLGQDLPGTDPTSRFEEGRQLLEPTFTEQRERLEQQLADQGIPRGSSAFGRELNRLEESQGRQLQQVARESVATSEAQRAARFNEISALLGQQQVGGIGFGQFSPQFSGLDLFGAEQAGIQRGFMAEQARKDRSAQQRAALFGSLGSLGGAGITAAFSDLRLKENIKEVGESESGILIYQFDYINKNHGEGRYEGVMAQDLQKIVPDAVKSNKEGYLMVDYGKIDVNFRRVN